MVSPITLAKELGIESFPRNIVYQFRPPTASSWNLIPQRRMPLAAEMFLVAYYGRQDKGTGCLLNKSDGGEISSKSGLQFRQLVRRVLLDIVKNPRSTNREKLEAVKIWKEIKK